MKLKESIEAMMIAVGIAVTSFWAYAILMYLVN